MYGCSCCQARFAQGRVSRPSLSILKVLRWIFSGFCGQHDKKFYLDSDCTHGWGTPDSCKLLLSPCSSRKLLTLTQFNSTAVEPEKDGYGGSPAVYWGGGGEAKKRRIWKRFWWFLSFFFLNFFFLKKRDIF